MNIVEDGQKRYLGSNARKLSRARRLLRLEVCRAYQGDLENADAVGRFYLKSKRWLELRRKLNRLEADLAGHLYLTAQ
jgi:hypothetical protein